MKYFYKPLFLHKNKMMLLKLDLIEGYVVKRPSRHVKTHYVADVLVGVSIETQQKEILAHSPSLGCCGLADASAVVLMEAHHKAGNKCSHTICLSIRDTQIIGINPKLAEQLVESALIKNCLSSLRNVEATSVASNPLKKGSLREPFYQ